MNWLTITTIAILAFALGWHLGRIVGFNDGLRRACELMQIDD